LTQLRSMFYYFDIAHGCLFFHLVPSHYSACAQCIWTCSDNGGRMMMTDDEVVWIFVQIQIY
jgi:hypothetical protein